MKNMKWFLALAVVISSLILTPGKGFASVVNDYYGGKTNTSTTWLCNMLGAVTPGYPCIEQDKYGTPHQVIPSPLWALQTACAWNDSNCLKANFINDIWSALNEGGGTNNFELNHVGGNYIVDTMIGQNNARTIYPDGRGNYNAYNDWVKRINQASVTAALINYTFTVNTAFDPLNNDIAQYSDSSVTAKVIMFSVNGVWTYAVKLDCGNPVGNLNPIPKVPPTSVSCVSMMLVPNSPPEVNVGFQIVATMTFSGGPNPPVVGASYMQVDGVGVPYTTAQTGTYGSGYTYKFSSGNITESAPGQYTVSWGAQINELGMKDCGGPLDAGAKFNVLTHPFLKVDGGDVSAGSGFAATDAAGNVTQPCPAATSNGYAGITSWNNGAPNYTGAGTQYGVFVLNLIHNFATHLGTPTPSSLSFANTSNVNLPAGLFGGYFGKPPCVDYWDTKQPVGSMNPLSGPSLNVTSLGLSGDYYHNGNLDILGSNKVQDGVRATVYVNGDVTISNDISYSSAATGWASANEMSSFRLIVHGKILIDNSVQNLDGVYVAIPNAGYQTAADNYANPNAGTIVTCSNGSSAYDPDTAAGVNSIQSQCTSLLTVNGSLIANHVFLLRTGGTASTNTPAEYVRYSPEEWLAPPSGGSVDTSYQAITGLPPVL